ncbi:hypothetical protein D3C78_1766060 [compost metagenome]
MTVEGQDIDTVFGYMAGTEADVTSAAQLSADFTVALVAASDPAEVTVTLGTCSFTYTEADDAATPADVSVITDTDLATPGC